MQRLLLVYIILTGCISLHASDIPNPLTATPVTEVLDGNLWQYQINLVGIDENGLPETGLPLVISTIGDHVNSVSVRHDLVTGDHWIRRDVRVLNASESGFELEMSFDRWTDKQLYRVRQLSLNVQRNGTDVTGSYTFYEKSGDTWLETTGVVNGYVQDEATLQALNPVAADQSWRHYAGTTTRFAATDGGAAIDPVLENARMVWKSPYVGGTELGSIRKLGTRAGRIPAEGGASPIIADGKVFMFRVIPDDSGPADVRYEIWSTALETGFVAPPEGYGFTHRFKESHYDEANENIEKSLATFREEGPFFKPVPIEETAKSLALFSDEQVICMDASTGRTLWTTTVPFSGLNTPQHKAALINHTGSYHDGRFFAFSSMGVVYAMNAETGAIEWRAAIPDYYAASQAAAAEALESRTVNGLNRSYNGALLAVEDVVVARTLPTGGELMAFDINTGDIRWQTDVNGRDGIIGNNTAQPVIWRHAGETYLISNWAR